LADSLLKDNMIPKGFVWSSTYGEPPIKYEIPEATGKRKRLIEATDKAQERKRKALNKWSKHK